MAVRKWGRTHIYLPLWKLLWKVPSKKTSFKVSFKGILEIGREKKRSELTSFKFFFFFVEIEGWQFFINKTSRIHCLLLNKHTTRKEEKSKILLFSLHFTNIPQARQYKKLYAFAFFVRGRSLFHPPPASTFLLISHNFALLK